jgi:electron-transferring-flavoprotein dehydrogenase
MGIGRDGKPARNFRAAAWSCTEIHADRRRARGSLAKQLIREVQARQECEPQKFGIGLKELWQVEPDKHKPGLVQHSSAGRST